ncbi:MAG: hypothetical protein Ct9H300mP23_10860 [Nitrospinota bacterium]|nr:MAG: hypothetical protein Ct9H300mP23_10860 [Nitrospinota bacterium]
MCPKEGEKRGLGKKTRRVQSPILFPSMILSDYTLCEMGTISLLTRKGEVAIAKRIEAGQDEVLSAWELWGYYSRVCFPG